MNIDFFHLLYCKIDYFIFSIHGSQKHSSETAPTYQLINLKVLYFNADS